jgi:hypothetical protein
MFYPSVLFFCLLSSANAAIKFVLNKRDDHEFVRDILARAAKGHKLSASVGSDGSIVINGE